MLIMITDSNLKVYIEKYNIHLKPIDLSLYEPQQRRCGLIGRHLTVFVGDQPPYRVPSVIVTNNLSRRKFLRTKRNASLFWFQRTKLLKKNPVMFYPNPFQNRILRMEFCVKSQQFHGKGRSFFGGRGDVPTPVLILATAGH